MKLKHYLLMSLLLSSCASSNTANQRNAASITPGCYNSVERDTRGWAKQENMIINSFSYSGELKEFIEKAKSGHSSYEESSIEKLSGFSRDSLVFLVELESRGGSGLEAILYSNKCDFVVRENLRQD